MRKSKVAVVLLSSAAFWSAAALARAAAADAGDSTSVGEIIVTAQRREEKLRDVPLSISAFTGQQLQDAGIRDTLSLTSTTPGLKMDRVGGFTLPSIRGVTTQVTSAGGDTNVAIYVDGVYQPPANSGTFDIPDIERVEVLKGPQGTLFGRNATGGAIQVFTREPGNDLAGSVTASYGRFDDLLLKGFVSVPLVKDKAALSVAGLYEESDGYLTNFLTGGHAAPVSSRLLRAKLMLRPTEDVKILLIGFYSKRIDGTNAFSTMLNGNTVGRAIPGSILLPGESHPYQVAVNPNRSQGDSWNKNYGFAGNLSWDVGPGTFKSITSWAKYIAQGFNDADNSIQPPGFFGLYYDAQTTDRAFTEEVSYASALDGPLNFVVGAFYIDQWGGWTPLNVLTDAFKGSIRARTNIEAYAGFGEVYFNLTDQLQLIGGLRYSWEKRDLTSSLAVLGTGTVIGHLTPEARGAAQPIGATKSWDSVTPRVSVKYAITPTANVYATYTQGFKSGIFQSSATSLQADGSLPLANPEKIKSYEVGFKGRLHDFLDVNLSAYHYDYKDVQVNSYTCIPAGSPTCVNLSILTNAASARINGLDFDATARFTREFTLRTGVSVLDAKYKDFKGAPIARPRTNLPPAACASVVGLPPTNTGNCNTFIDASGNRMIRAPKFTINVTPTYRTDFAGGELLLTSTVYHTSPVNFTFDGRISQKAYTTVDGRISWSPHDSGLTLAVYGQNITNVKRIQTVFSTDAGDAVGYAPPDTYGVEATYRF